MSAVKGANTRPERDVRTLLHAMGFRFRLHAADLPGKPDVVLPKHKALILVHGCFWHQHPGCRKATVPRHNSEYWRRKLERNVARDAANRAALEAAGWRVITVWTCERRVRDREALAARLRAAILRE